MRPGRCYRAAASLAWELERLGADYQIVVDAVLAPGSLRAAWWTRLSSAPTG